MIDCARILESDTLTRTQNVNKLLTKSERNVSCEQGTCQQCRYFCLKQVNDWDDTCLMDQPDYLRTCEFFAPDTPLSKFIKSQSDQPSIRYWCSFASKYHLGDLSKLVSDENHEAIIALFKNFSEN